MLQEQTRLMTLEEYMDLYDAEGPFEIVNGERIQLMPNVGGPSWTIRALFVLLYNFCVTGKLGEVFTETTFVRIEKPNWVKGSRVPDIMFFAAARWASYLEENPDWTSKPFVLIPDLAIEVVSPNNRFSKIQDKVDEYLRNGVKLVWVIDPQRRWATVYQGNQLDSMDENGTLTGSDVVPGFEVKLAELFQ